MPASQNVVPDPENYTIEFKSDGTFAAKADCNQLAGTYTTTSSGGLTIVPGPMTLALCPEASLDTLYMAGLSGDAELHDRQQPADDQAGRRGHDDLQLIPRHGRRPRGAAARRYPTATSPGAAAPVHSVPSNPICANW